MNKLIKNGLLQLMVHKMQEEEHKQNLMYTNTYQKHLEEMYFKIHYLKQKINIIKQIEQFFYQSYENKHYKLYMHHLFKKIKIILKIKLILANLRY